MKKVWKKTAVTVTVAAAALALYGCAGSSDTEQTGTAAADKEAEATVVEVGVVGEYNDQWDTINELLAPENIQVKLVKFTDYAAPNRALADGDIDLNAFQTKTFLDNDMTQKGYDLTVVGDTIIAPLAIYNNKDKISSVSDIKDGDIITITTKTGNKTVTLEREGVTTNIINRLVSGSTWLTLKQGENKFYVRASEGLSSLKVRLIHRNAYLGV